MKKTKIWLSVLALVLAFALSACGGKGGDPAQDWDAAFAESSFANYKMTATEQYEEYSSVMEMQVDGKKIKSTSDGTVTYLSEENGKFYNYRQENGVWIKMESTFGGAMISFDFLKSEKDSFTLSNGYYVCKEAKFKEIVGKILGVSTVPDGVAGTVKLKLTDGKLAEIAVERTYNGEIGSQSMAFSDYGKVIVTLPVIEEPSVPAEQDWNAAFSASSFENCKVVMTDESEGENETSIIQIDGEKSKMTFANTDRYSTKENGKFYSYEQRDGMWIKSETKTQSSYVPPFQLLQDEKNSFELIDGAYVCKQERFLQVLGKLTGEEDIPEGMVGSITLKLADNKLVEIAVVMSMPEETPLIQRMVFSEYGNITVVLPDAVDEWSAAFAVSSFTNYTMATYFMATSLEGQVMNYSTTAYIDNGKIRMTTDGQEFYQAEENGKFYSYSQVNDMWTKAETTDPVVLPAFTFLQAEKDSFTWIGGNYVCKDEKLLEIVGKIVGADAVREGMTGTMTIRMRNGQLNHMEIRLEYQGETTSSYEIQFYSYGTTVVSLPQVG